MVQKKICDPPNYKMLDIFSTSQTPRANQINNITALNIFTNLYQMVEKIMKNILGQIFRA